MKFDLRALFMGTQQPALPPVPKRSQGEPDPSYQAFREDRDVVVRGVIAKDALAKLERGRRFGDTDPAKADEELIEEPLWEITVRGVPVFTEREKQELQSQMRKQSVQGHVSDEDLKREVIRMLDDIRYKGEAMAEKLDEEKQIGLEKSRKAREFVLMHAGDFALPPPEVIQMVKSGGNPDMQPYMIGNVVRQILANVIATAPSNEPDAIIDAAIPPIRSELDRRANL